MALITYPMLIVAAHYHGKAYVQIFLPLYKTILETLEPKFTVKSILIVESPGSNNVEVIVSNKEKRFIGMNVISLNAEVNLTTLQGHSLQHAILMCTLLVFWLGATGASAVEWLATLVIALFILVSVEIMDIPFVLAGSLQDFLLYNLAPELLADSLTVKWMMFLNGGGRLALSVAGAMLAISVTHFSVQLYRHRRTISLVEA